MTAIGVYPQLDELFEALFSEYYSFTDKELISHMVTHPAFAILQEYKEGRVNEFIARERYRKWVEDVEETVSGGCLPEFFEWEDVASGDWQEYLNNSCCFSCTTYNWTLFLDDAWGHIYLAADKAWLSDDIHELLSLLINETNYEGDIVVHSMETGRIYVVRSKERAERGALGDCQVHPYLISAPFSDALREGPTDTYLLPNDIFTGEAGEEMHNYLEGHE
jgi:hypothetical protein